jgi:hypothetical protein
VRAAIRIGAGRLYAVTEQVAEGADLFEVGRRRGAGQAAFEVSPA